MIQYLTRKTLVKKSVNVVAILFYFCDKLSDCLFWESNVCISLRVIFRVRSYFDTCTYSRVTLTLWNKTLRGEGVEKISEYLSLNIYYCNKEVFLDKIILSYHGSAGLNMKI